MRVLSRSILGLARACIRREGDGEDFRRRLGTAHHMDGNEKWAESPEKLPELR